MTPSASRATKRSLLRNIQQTVRRPACSSATRRSSLSPGLAPCSTSDPPREMRSMPACISIRIFCAAGMSGSMPSVAGRFGQQRRAKTTDARNERLKPARCLRLRPSRLQLVDLRLLSRLRGVRAAMVTLRLVPWSGLDPHPSPASEAIDPSSDEYRHRHPCSGSLAGACRESAVRGSQAPCRANRRRRVARSHCASLAAQGCMGAAQPMPARHALNHPTVHGAARRLSRRVEHLPTVEMGLYVWSQHPRAAFADCPLAARTAHLNRTLFVSLDPGAARPRRAELLWWSARRMPFAADAPRIHGIRRPLPPAVRVRVAGVRRHRVSAVGNRCSPGRTR